jgi:hypothetical protein
MGDVEAGMVGLLSQRSPQTGKIDAQTLRQSLLVRRPTDHVGCGGAFGVGPERCHPYGSLLISPTNVSNLIDE